MRVLITGGLGLVGSNYARHCLEQGHQVVVLDGYTRGRSCKYNEEWLRKYGASQFLRIVRGNVALSEVVQSALKQFDGIDRVVHAAAQSSVNVSMEAPEVDFSSNVIGTFTLLDELRCTAPKAKVLYLASNKVYDVTGWPVELVGSRYRWVGNRQGPSEQFPFYTDAKEPYGASKIAGLYYSRCYAAMYDMPIVIVVPSGMYGPRQFGRSAQGWLGWFCIATLLGLPIEIKGDGFQVRDMLHVQDVCLAFDRLFEVADVYKGELFNLGGGVRNAVSLVEALGLIADTLGMKSKIVYGDWRPQDNKVYVSNIERMVGMQWHPTVSIQVGVKDMCTWVKSEEAVLRALYTGQN